MSVWFHLKDDNWSMFSADANKQLEQAFHEGRNNLHINDQSEDFDLTLSSMSGSKNQDPVLLIRQSGQRDNHLPWQFEEALGKYVPMCWQISCNLSDARKAGFTKFCFRFDAIRGYDYDLRKMTQQNIESGVTRNICPAPIPVTYPKAPKGYPKEFKCPITHSFMNDPVIAEDGQTYERFAIEQWFAASKLSSPITNELLTTPKLYPNQYMKNKISSWRLKQSKSPIKKGSLTNRKCT